ncbi:MAG: hypothetical protein ABWY06_06200 [Pseudomonas sp.]|uniref:hypothetical protein n=1 Tax=Pseudomonas sp. TaxID=306 RepID=UPI003391AD82
MSTLAVPLIALTLVFFALFLLYKRLATPSTSGAGGNAKALEQQLLQRCFGDRAMANRLIEHELAKRQGLSRSQAIEYAAASLQLDKR